MSNGCFSRGLRFNSKQPFDDSLLSTTPVPEDLMPLLALWAPVMHTGGRLTNRKAKYPYI